MNEQAIETGNLFGSFLRLIAILMSGAVVFLSCSGKGKSESASADELFAKAFAAQANGDYLTSYHTYDELITRYPNHPKIDKAYFMRGFIKLERMNDNAGATQDLTYLIEKYPNSDLVDDAKFIIESIDSGKDILSTFEQKSGTR